jgi:hypothetical protein
VFANRVLRKIFRSNSEKLTEVGGPCQMRNFMSFNKHFSGDKIDKNEMGMAFILPIGEDNIHKGLL